MTAREALDARLSEASILRISLLPIILGVVAGCTAGSAARAARTDAPGAAEALGRAACGHPGNDTEPWVVDLPADRRVEIEAAMQKGITFVSYDCHELKLLRGCDVAGAYDYTGTTTIEDKLALEDADAVALNLSGGAALAAKVRADIDRGMKIHIGYVLVGQRSTNLAWISRSELPGRCQGATHFIGRASIGAYAIASSSSAQMGSVAEIFERGASAQSTSSALRTTTVGEPRACNAATVDDTGPPPQCAAPVKLLLVGIAPGTEPPPDAPRREDEPLALAAKMFRDACDRGNARACSDVGHQARLDHREAEAVKWFERACKLGYGRACFHAGSLLVKSGKEDADKRALEDHERACLGRDHRGCLAMAAMLFSGVGALPDPAKANQVQSRALNALMKACEAKDSEACEVLGDFYNGRYGKKTRSPEKALEYFERACSGGQWGACDSAGALLARGDGPVKADPDRSRGYREQACRHGIGEACKRAQQGDP